MPRLLSSMAVLAVVTPAVIGLPVATVPTAAPHPVTPSVERLPLAPLPAATSGPALRRSAVGLPARPTKPFTLLGVTWRHDPQVDDVHAQVRTRKGTTWSAWEELHADGDDAPDAGSVDTAAGLRDGTAPLYVGRSSGVEVRVTADGPAQPQDVRVELVDPGTSAADARPAPPSTAHAAQSQPQVLTRKDWGADESLRRGSPSYTSTIKVGFVHHTAGATSYTQAEVPGILRSIYAYHVKSNGWSDVGYNFLVDRFGRIWEGRYGGITKAVAGAHTGGFNAESFGVSLIGTYETAVPPAAMLTSLQQLLAWKLGAYYRDPLGKATLRSAGGGTSRYPAGTYHDFDVVSGHRDAGSTSCPGAATYARMGTIRSAVSDLVGTSFVGPAASRTKAQLGDREPVRITAKTRRDPVWALDVLTSTGATVRSFPRPVTAATGTVDIAWDLTDAKGMPVPAGTYTLRLTGTSATGETALPWTVPFNVRFPSLPKGSWMRPGQLSTRERTKPSPTPTR